ncbi:hypothetical protein F383_08653 [Gossypium arboreum]|uniref:Uncharacterized protein n=1 Tax=Gossypium arboreum TaxID=29729 RepID=A0A0B0PEX5_GOSAR|nr:hypothetical protein F383_08653 [Gossypium arboreum]
MEGLFCNMVESLRPRNTKSGPRSGEGQASRLNPISRLLFCRQTSIKNQGTSEASITLSPEAFGIVSLNVLSMACIGTSSFCLVSC